jgi:hypothetical protein
MTRSTWDDLPGRIRESVRIGALSDEGDEPRRRLLGSKGSTKGSADPALVQHLGNRGGAEQHEVVSFNPVTSLDEGSGEQTGSAANSQNQAVAIPDRASRSRTLAAQLSA